MSNPDVWAQTVFIVMYDENGGFFDQVPPVTGPAGHRRGGERDGLDGGENVSRWLGPLAVAKPVRLPSQNVIGLPGPLRRHRRRLCATRNRAAWTVRRAQSSQFCLVLPRRRAFIAGMRGC